MCNLNCATCAFLGYLYKISLGKVSSDKLKYCHYYDLFVVDVVAYYKLGLLQ